MLNSEQLSGPTYSYQIWLGLALSMWFRLSGPCYLYFSTGRMSGCRTFIHLPIKLHYVHNKVTENQDSYSVSWLPIVTNCFRISQPQYFNSHGSSPEAPLKLGSIWMGRSTGNTTGSVEPSDGRLGDGKDQRRSDTWGLDLWLFIGDGWNMDGIWMEYDMGWYGYISGIDVDFCWATFGKSMVGWS